MIDSTRFLYLLERYEDSSATEAEKTDLLDFFGHPEMREDISGLLLQALENTPPKDEAEASKWQPLIDRILHGEKDLSVEHNGKPFRVFRLKRFWWAAAAILFVLAAGGYFYFNRTDKNNRNSQSLAHDVAAPKNNRATITLANGEKVFLDSAANGKLAIQGAVQITKSDDGKINYNGNGKLQPINEVAYNTLYNPRGSKLITLTLADGTKVWLNAASSLKFPVAFNGNTRSVEITGEAYFEVKHDPEMPFMVKAKNEIIQDIGTEFDVSAYEDEPLIKTTVLKGSVKTGSKNSSLILLPNQQCLLGEDGDLKLNKEVDIEKETAWKNNTFIFEDDDIRDIMRKLSRWYDIDIVLVGDIDQHHYTGQIGMDESLSRVLKIFENVGYLKFKINNKELKVMPATK